MNTTWDLSTSVGPVLFDSFCADSVAGVAFASALAFLGAMVMQFLAQRFQLLRATNVDSITGEPDMSVGKSMHAAIAYGALVFLSYTLMAVFMTMNVYVDVSLAAGAAAGYLMFGYPTSIATFH